MPNWFEELTGFREESPEQVRENMTVEGEILTSRVNGRSVRHGRLETPSLSELRTQVGLLPRKQGKLSIRETVGDVRHFHKDSSNTDALFQVASQFNLLEMIGPEVTPGKGVGRYADDPTQGPACAIAAGAGTIYRNYFAPTNGRVGQTANSQIDCLADVGIALGKADERLWKMRNGYVQATSLTSVTEIGEMIRQSSESERDNIRRLLRIGIHSETEVTLDHAGHTVTQAYCSALPLGMYSPYPTHLWEPFARLALEASYEATICASIINASRTGNNKVFLTLVGGGAFGNEESWIIDAMERAIMTYKDAELDIMIVSYSRQNPAVNQLVRRFGRPG